MSWPGLPPRRVDQVRQLGSPATAPGSSSVIRARVIIVTGAGDGIFVYAPGTTPGLGNPPIAWMGGGLVDPYGNVLPSTTGVAATGSFQAGNTIVNASGIFVYAGTPGPTTLAYSVTETNVHDPFGTITGIGFCSYAPGNQASLTAAQLNFGTAAGSTRLFASSAGTMEAQTAANFSGALPLGVTDDSILTASTVAFSNVSAAYTYPANDANNGTRYRITAWGDCTQVATTEIVKFQLAAFGTAFGGLSIAGLWFAASTTYEWTAWAIVSVPTAGGAGTGVARGWQQVGMSVFGGSLNPSTTGTNQGTGAFTGGSGNIAVNTTAASTMALQAAVAVTQPGLQVRGLGSMFERLGP